MKDPACLEICQNENKDDQQIWIILTSKCNLAALCNFYQWYELLVLNRVSQKSNDTLVCNIYSYLALPIVSRALIIPVYNVWKMLTFWEIYIHTYIHIITCDCVYNCVWLQSQFPTLDSSIQYHSIHNNLQSNSTQCPVISKT